MSIKVMTRIIEHSEARLGDRLVLIALADFANDEGRCWPSVRSICQWSRLSERSVQESLRRLADAGEISIYPQAGPKGCNLYRVNAQRGADSAPPQKLHPAESAPGGAEYNRGGAEYDIKPPQNLHPNHHRTTNKTIKEPSSDQPAADRSPSWSFDSWFENIFWPAYPNKAGKAKAKVGLAKVVRSDSKAAEVLAGLDRWKASHQWADGFIQHGSTWVNGQMWQDEPETAEAAAARLTREKDESPRKVVVKDAALETPREERIVKAPSKARPIPADWLPGIPEDTARPIVREAFLTLQKRLGAAPSDHQLVTESRRLWREANPNAPRATWEESEDSPTHVADIVRQAFSASAATSAVH